MTRKTSIIGTPNKDMPREHVRRLLEMRYGIKSISIPESDQKTPDLFAFSGNDFDFFIEVKTIRSVPSRGTKEKIQTYARNKYADKIDEALEQFKIINPEHKHPNVLVWINLNTDLNDNLFVFALQSFSKTRSKIALQEIDLQIWYDRANHHPEKLFFSEDALNARRLYEAFGVDFDRRGNELLY